MFSLNAAATGANWSLIGWWHFGKNGSKDPSEWYHLQRGSWGIYTALLSVSVKECLWNGMDYSAGLPAQPAVRQQACSQPWEGWGALQRRQAHMRTCKSRARLARSGWKVKKLCEGQTVKWLTGSAIPAPSAWRPAFPSSVWTSSPCHVCLSLSPTPAVIEVTALPCNGVFDSLHPTTHWQV